MNQLNAQNINSEVEFHSETIKVKYLSPLSANLNSPQGTTEFIQNKQEEEEQSIKFHGTMKFKNGFVQNEEGAEIYIQNRNANIQTNLIQLNDQTQWSMIQSNEFSTNSMFFLRILQLFISGWIVKNHQIYDPEDKSMINTKQLKKELKLFESDSNNLSSENHRKNNRIIEMFSSLIFLEPNLFDRMISAKKSQKLQFTYNQLKSHQYIQIKGNFIFFTEFWSVGSKAWCKVDNQLVWMHPINKNSNKHICSMLIDLEKIFSENGRDLQQKMVKHLQGFNWITQFSTVVKHMNSNIQIEFGILVKGIDNSCGEDYLQLFQFLSKNVYMFGFDDFQLFIR